MATNISMTSPGGTPQTLVLPDGSTVTTNASGVVNIPSQFVSVLLNAGWAFTSAPGT